MRSPISDFGFRVERAVGHASSIRNPQSAIRNGFTFVEFMVLFGIVVILLSMFVPYVLNVWESERRTRCNNNLKQLRDALKLYAKDYGVYPRVVYDSQNNSNGYTAFTGIDDPNPFAPNSSVSPNDVTASLWLLVRLGLVDTRVFVCPSTDDSRDLLTDASGRFVKPDARSNFRRAEHLSYSYFSPFSSAPGYRIDIDRKGDTAILADKSPGTGGDGDSITGPAWDAPALELAKTNSRNHGKAGQNVLYADGSVFFRRTAYCGFGLSGGAGDNIYTTLAPAPLLDRQMPHYLNGFWGNDVGPAWEADSYLVPTDDEKPTAGRAASTQSALATPPSTTSTAPVIEPPTTVPSEGVTTRATQPTPTAPATTTRE
jgi:type II secretory pathway pseudopilin PulG